ncbi:SDR family NAD(P)-dependent oxidoreductase [Streptomyces viridosporus]|uniref:SDR family NAD(P)-dependent oxidoreductase n=1 Tax=Streptomyces viridosporus T7A TaxID=665577 RepID=A0ABX6ANQ3_STRVD|nr:SDR family NAD(P)-dependent oxidoreductase [Streptomyces viridosporus]QEU88594.1 SDR family NAD(P)-dependent oxidoreductase [Streptomyces viridosporus T7A]
MFGDNSVGYDANFPTGGPLTLDLERIIGRQRIRTGLESSAGLLRGRRILVTGAGGYIGSELCRQLSRWEPESLMMLDRNETALHLAATSIGNVSPSVRTSILLADIRDSRGLARLFQQCRPDTVFHAAALKWVPILEKFPGEAVKTNVFGTRAVLEAALAADVAFLVNISTDKAVDPVGVLGYSKRIAEGLTAAAAIQAGRPYVSVRFGNVLGCQGSFLDVFARQIAAGRPVTVTHPEVTRYLMTVQEAVELVIQSVALGSVGHALVLDMGEQVRILDIARRLIAHAGAELPVRYVGLRPGEKLTEALVAPSESPVRHVHPKIMEVPVPALKAGDGPELDAWGEDQAVVAALRATCLAMAGDDPVAQDPGHRLV